LFEVGVFGTRSSDEVCSSRARRTPTVAFQFSESVIRSEA
jgi:hypothetical protein